MFDNLFADTQREVNERLAWSELNRSIPRKTAHDLYNCFSLPTAGQPFPYALRSRVGDAKAGIVR
jgi:hypothetical protein